MKKEEQKLISHFDEMKNAFSTSHNFAVKGAGDDATLFNPALELDLSKSMVQHYERNPLCSQFLLRNGLEVYFYNYHDVLVITG